MENAIIAALIGAGGAILAALIPVLLLRKNAKPEDKPSPLPADAPPASTPTRHPMDWQQLLAALQRSLRPGQVTTYGECSQWANGHRRGSPSIVAMLNAIARRGHQVWSNRVVQDDGGIAEPPDTGYGQRAQLAAEGVPFDGDRVDLTRCPAVALH
jgi:alkylated DNA nucleotide flippase Atl1